MVPYRIPELAVAKQNLSDEYRSSKGALGSMGKLQEKYVAIFAGSFWVTIFEMGFSKMQVALFCFMGHSSIPILKD